MIGRWMEASRCISRRGISKPHFQSDIELRRLMLTLGVVLDMHSMVGLILTEIETGY
jgi:hypothetical protein